MVAKKRPQTKAARSSKPAPDAQTAGAMPTSPWMKVFADRPKLFGFPLGGILSEAELRKASTAAGKSKAASEDTRTGSAATIVYLGSDAKKSEFHSVAGHLPSWQVERFERSKAETFYFANAAGPMWVVYPSRNPAKSQGHQGSLDKSAYGRARDALGTAVSQLRDFGLQSLVLRFVHCSGDEKIGALVGFELAMYEFIRARQGRFHEGLPQQIIIEGATAQERDAAVRLGASINIARHLTNLPSSDLSPVSYADAVADLFAGAPSTWQVEVMDERRLVKERMNLLLAVGRGSATPPRVVHLRYRPKGSSAKAPTALVGKGVTFDTGGVNMKDAGGMRLMKKDMGGSASIVGFAHWVMQAAPNQLFDFYISLADNAVDGASYRPGDVITSRSGKTVEIHNTDAEGRLVMADVFDYALSMKDRDAPGQLINLATLTGAIKVALGVELAGLFSNHDGLADRIMAAGIKTSDRCWRMPLVQEYRPALASPVADMTNAGNSSFGGAITAALFLESFVQQRPWAHLDIYAWTDRPQGAFKEVGATGQGVQLLVEMFG